MFRYFRSATGLLCVGLVSGCASYYTHYAVFPANNSAGEERQFKLTWQTADYPDWWIMEDQSTPMTLTSQCSERKWRLVDASHDEAGQQNCANGIRACGDPARDLWAETGAPVNGQQACMQVNPSKDGAEITDISSALELTVSCQPSQTNRRNGEELENVDYLRASVVPYTIYSRKGIRGRLDSRPPQLEDDVCEEE